MTATAAPAEQALWRDTERCYRAVTSRDARFDGQFITAVRTTGIYCRPSCPALTPRQENVRFYPTAAAAQAAGFRACRRCLPDAVPGSPLWDVRADLAARAMRLIADGVVERDGVPGLARHLGYSERQLGRVLTAELGAGPLALARAHRAHSARLLIELSELPLADVAFAAGFTSVRQFNDTIRDVFARTPSQLRTAASAARRRSGAADPEARRRKGNTGPEARRPKGDTGPEAGTAAGTRLSLRLPFRPPFDAGGILGFFAARAVPGVEAADEHSYARTLRLPHGAASVTLTPQDGHVRCDLRLADVRDLGAAVTRARRLLDLDADPEAVARVLGADPALAPAVAAAPGIRVPGAADGFELVLRAMLGQQISVAAARTAAARLTAALGDPVPWQKDTLLFPTAEAVAERGHEVLRGPKRRIDAILSAAAAVASGDIDVHVGRDAAELRAELLGLTGVGPWTADYVLMRVLGAPDVLLTGDLVLRKGASALGIADDIPALTERAQAWRPWRSYAGMYLWRSSQARTA
ncbi:AlkA N-terminal domain-containing protein [Amycolatopsis endophytica]|uniref:DNA-3-methyladenine glycosylase II n=1 Tax=Amycolatopsis endophytica TaxID=860233 RepID=A0A853B3G8_9PSEU|nr:AlkA N-terminal domain-containing protein [Amycolatopsis endophytica]NYI89559.1 AraC family transcriptional regulator of adaptative response / DNA-3-methyladenine glycosylase II [Amycolatopsis endophytica]